MASPPSVDIIGGSNAVPGEFVFMAAILSENISGTDYDKQFCGCALIAAQWVLTAAHPVEGVASRELAVAVGRTTLSASDQSKRRAVAEVHVHPRFSSPVSLAHDAALLKLASPVSQSPIRLATAADGGSRPPARH